MGRLHILTETMSNLSSERPPTSGGSRQRFLEQLVSFLAAAWLSTAQLDVVSGRASSLKADAVAHNVGDGLCFGFANLLARDPTTLASMQQLMREFVRQCGKFFNPSAVSLNPDPPIPAPKVSCGIATCCETFDFIESRD
jgi:hypothetical protein